MGREDQVKKGPWGEEEDKQLIGFVGLFGDRRWDFIAGVSGLKVAGEDDRYLGFDFGQKIISLFSTILLYVNLLYMAGLKRSGKSCRLRWVNYLHPGLKRGKMTPQEERLVLELHSKWGNRWSRIARRLPGRTDNEIKNYWRTHVRKTAQEKKRAVVLSPSSSSSDSDSSPSNDHAQNLQSFPKTGEESNCNAGSLQFSALKEKKSQEKDEELADEINGYSMDDIWKDIEESENYSFACPPTKPSLSWLDYYQGPMWKMEEEEEKSNMISPITGPVLSSYQHWRSLL